jgi:hypothetical protein
MASSGSADYRRSPHINNLVGFIALGLGLLVARKVVKSGGRIPNTLVFFCSTEQGEGPSRKKKRVLRNDKSDNRGKERSHRLTDIGFPSGVVTLEGGNY